MNKLPILIILLTLFSAGCQQVQQHVAEGQPVEFLPRANVSEADVPDPTLPNFVVIMTDDQHIDTLQFMPILQEELMANGMQFTRAYVTTPVCCPSRSSFLLGQYMHNHELFWNFPRETFPNWTETNVLRNTSEFEALGGFSRFRDLGHEAHTVAVALDDIGYRTGLIGKYLTMYPYDTPYHVPQGWDEWRGWSNRNTVFPRATDELVVDYIQGNTSYYHYFINHNGTPLLMGDSEEDYLTDYISREAVAFLENTPQDQPFFLFLNPYAPHHPFTPADRHRGVYADEQVTDISLAISENFDEYTSYLETLLAIDEMIGAVTQQLDEMGIRDNTYIIFMTDNGVDISQRGRDFGKGRYFEENIRTPLIITGPNVPAGTVNSQPVLNIDFAPTLTSLAGTTMPIVTDGQSIVPLLNGEIPDWRQNFLIQNQSLSNA